MTTETNDWKNRNNDVSNLTVAELIQNTIEEEMIYDECKEVCPIEGNPCKRHVSSFHVSECGNWENREGYYRAIAILNEVL